MEISSHFCQICKSHLILSTWRASWFLQILSFLLLFGILHSCTDKLAILSTASVTSITDSSALSGGNIISDGGAGIIYRGVCWSTEPNPTIEENITVNGSGSGTFTSVLSSLSESTTYYVRAYATNSVGTAYGSQQSFTTPEKDPILFNPDLVYGFVADIDGNTYKTIQIGTQVWMAENLKTTRYNDGTKIPLVSDSLAWQNLEGYDEYTSYHYVYPGFCWYGNDTARSKKTYGALYNFSAVIRGKVCPSGWNVPDMNDWETLTDYLGRMEVAGGKLKEAGFTHWKNPNTGADNSSGFTALPGGMRISGATFMLKGNMGYWWTGVSMFRATGIAWQLSYDKVTAQYIDAANANSGLSVRCIKNNTKD
jgi:uncharacterized protein (TIGR02145 family)